jgi:hypothetical protein
MNKLLLGIFSVFYLIMSCGLVLNVHYCMGHLSSIDPYLSISKKCGHCGMEDGKCCHSESKVLKLSTDQQVAGAGIDIASQPAVLHEPVADMLLSVQGMEMSFQPHYHSPPESHLPALYLRYGAFRI